MPAKLTNTDNFPFDFFNSTDPAVGNGRKRGLVYQNTGTAFRVDSSEVSCIDASYAAQFDAFSPKKTFTYLGNNITDVVFKVAEPIQMPPLTDSDLSFLMWMTQIQPPWNFSTG